MPGPCSRSLKTTTLPTQSSPSTTSSAIQSIQHNPTRILNAHSLNARPQPSPLRSRAGSCPAAAAASAATLNALSPLHPPSLTTSGGPSRCPRSWPTRPQLPRLPAETIGGCFTSSSLGSSPSSRAVRDKFAVKYTRCLLHCRPVDFCLRRKRHWLRVRYLVATREGLHLVRIVFFHASNRSYSQGNINAGPGSLRNLPLHPNTGTYPSSIPRRIIPSTHIKTIAMLVCR